MLIATLEVIGPSTNGGIGTALTSLAHSLADAGHRVTVLFLLGGVPGHEQVYQQWVDFYAAKGIELVGLVQRPGAPLPGPMVMSVDVLGYLHRNGPFDVVHCQDYLGACYYSMLSKAQGDPALARTSLVVGMHGPVVWAKGINQESIADVADLEIDFMERKCVELADYVVRCARPRPPRRPASGARPVRGGPRS